MAARKTDPKTPVEPEDVSERAVVDEEPQPTFSPPVGHITSDDEPEADIIRVMPPEIRRKMIKTKGNKDYLQVADRLIWFRKDHPAESGWGICSTPIEINFAGNYAIFHASITDPEGRIVGQGIKSETKADFGDYIEKAATGAIGRALAVIGYGTQFTGDEFHEGNRLADAPYTPASQLRGNTGGVTHGSLTCAECGVTVTTAQSVLSNTKFGHTLCTRHQEDAVQAKRAADDLRNRTAPRVSVDTLTAMSDICHEMGWDLKGIVRNFMKDRNAIAEGMTQEQGNALLDAIRERSATEVAARSE